MADYFRVLASRPASVYDKKIPAGVAAAEIRPGQFDNWIGPERLIMDVVRWYEEWDGTLTPDYNAAAVSRGDHRIQPSQGQRDSHRDHLLDRMEALAHGC